MNTACRRPVRSLGSSLLLVLALFLTMVGMAPPSAAVDDAHITGTVTALTGGAAPDINVSVYAYDEDFAYWSWVAGGTTGFDGTYDIGGLPADTYRVFFDDYFNGFYVPQAYDNAPDVESGTDVAVAEDAVVGGIDAALSTPGSVAGTVTDGTDPIEGVQVTAYLATGSGFDPMSSDTTGPDGTYDVTGLATVGSYRLGFVDPSGVWAPEFWNDQPTVEAADAVEVGPSEAVVGKDAALAAPGSIAGVVTGPTGDLLEGINVTVHQMLGEDLQYAAGAVTAADGSYEVTGLAGGSYRLGFEDFSGAHRPEYWDDKASLETADDVAVTLGNVTGGINAQLATPSSIAGTVTDGTNPLEGISVAAYLPGDFGHDQVGWATTDADGHYLVDDLDPGTYRLGFEDYTSTYAGEYWNDKTTLAAADEIVVGASNSVVGKDAVLDEPGAVTGTVTDTGGAPLEDINVSIHRGAGEDSEYVAGVTTGADGTYEIGGLSAGADYRVFFEDYSGQHLSEYWNDKPTLQASDAVAVSLGTVTPDVDAQLSSPSSLGGRVSDAADTDLAGIAVTLLVDEGWGYEWGEQVTTGADGTYAFPAVPPGTYRLRFEDPDGNFQREFWQDARTAEEADDIVVGTDQELTYDAQLNAASRIEGTVTAEGGAALAGITVTAYGYDEQWGGGWESVSSAQTAADGTYRVKGLVPGVYRIGFSDPAEQRVPEYWNDVARIRKAANIHVGESDVVTGKNAVLPLGGAIAGTVTAEGGGVLEGISVTAYEIIDGEPDYLTSATTDATGDYTLSGLRAGEYRLQFTDYDGHHLSEAWDDAPNVWVGDDIVVSGTGTVADRDAALTPVSHLQGTVSGPSGPVSGVTVTAYQQRSDEWYDVESVATNASGQYDVGGLEAGTYRLRFSHHEYIREYWDDKPLLAEADDIVLGAAATRAALDAVLTPSGSISGQVTAPGGAPLAEVDVTAYDANGDAVGGGETDAAGAYTVRGLDPGSYRLRFSDFTRQHLIEYYDDALTLGAATPIDVASGQAVTGKDAELAVGGTITGTLTGPGGTGLDDASVEVYQETPEGFDYLRQTGTDSAGNYSLKGLPTGTYRVFFEPPTLDLVGEYYDDAESLDAADDITVTVAATTAGIDAQLGEASSIAGTLTTTGGAPLDGVDVTAYRVVDGDFQFARFTTSQGDGTYRLGGLGAGTYRLELDAPSGYVDEYWDDQATLAESTDIVVAAQTAVTGKDALIASRATGISGVVTDPGGDPAPGIAVTVYRWEGDYFDWYDSATTGGDGSYRVAGLPAGTYTVGFFDQRDGVFASEYWQDVPTLEAATTFAVADSMVTGKDAQLALGGTLSGKVRDPGGDPVPGVWVTVYRQVGETFQRYHGSDSRTTGLYLFEGLPAGTYKLGFEPGFGGYADEFYDNAATLAAATPITLATGQTSSGLDVALAAPTEVVNVEPPSIFGSALVGSTLSADPGWWNPSDATFAYQWLANGDPIVGATQDTYELQPSDLGDLVSVRVTASKSGLTSGVATSEPEGPVQNPPTPPLVSDTPPAISGTTQVGFTLTADPGTWTPSGATFAYQWLAGGEPIAGATAATYVLQSTDLGDMISVRVTASKTGYEPTPATSAGVGPVTNPPTPPVVNDTLPSISGVAEVGSTLTADPGTWTPADATFAYQWRAGSEPIGGATSATYVVASGDLGKTISVRVTASKSGFTPGEATSSGTGPVVNPTIVNVTDPSITGTAKVGQVLTADGGTWNPADAALAYQWRVDGDPVVGATATTYTPVEGDVGKTVTVRVTATKSGFEPASEVSAGAGPVTPAEAPSVVNVTAPSISGTPQVGEVLTANGGTWNPADAALAYQWRADGEPVAGETATTYTPVAGDVGKTITVRVTASKSGFDPASEISAGVGPVAAAPVPAVSNVTAPSVSGVAKVGSVLTAVRGTWNPSDASTTVQWLVNGAAVAGATGNTFPLGAAHAGKRVSVLVTASKAGHTDATATSAQTAPVALGTIICSAPPKISGMAKVGKTLAVSKGTWAPAGVRLAYQWLANGKAIKGATKNKLKVTKAMKGKKLTVKVKATTPGYAAKTVTTKPTRKVV